MQNDEHQIASPGRVDRRRLLGATGAGTVALGTLAAAATVGLTTREAQAQGITDATIANLTLNFEYLGAELYSRALTGQGLAAADTTGGDGTPGGGVTGGRPVTFATPLVQQLISQFLRDELGHVRTLRALLGGNAIAEPAIDLQASFAAVAAAAGLGAGFDAFADENSLLLASFSIEDVCVTALRGAAPLVQNKTVLSIASGFLGVEAYQASAVRTLLFQRGFGPATVAIATLRASLSGALDDEGAVTDGLATIVPSDGNGLVFARTPRQVLNIAYGAPNAAAGGFFPAGVNGALRA